MPFDLASLGKWLIGLGLGLAALGGLVWLAGRFGLPLGRLPGDIHVQRDGFSLYFPLASSIVVSLVLSALITLLARLLRR